MTTRPVSQSNPVWGFSPPPGTPANSPVYTTSRVPGAILENGTSTGDDTTLTQATVDLIRTIVPYLPEELIRVYAASWVDPVTGGDASFAWAAVRADPVYNSYFPGNRRDDGSFRMTESAYLQTVLDRNQELQNYGLDPNAFRDGVVASIVGEQSTDEFRTRLSVAWSEVVDNLPGVADAFAAANGIVTDEAAIFGMFIDPELEDAVLQRKIDVAQISAAGTSRNFTLTAEGLDQMAAFGVTQDQAYELFGVAAQALPTLRELARRHNDPDDTFDIDEFVAANIFTDPAQNARIKRLSAAERALFAPTQTVRRTGNAVTGLRPV